MHWTTHVVIGGALGYLIEHPLPAFAAGFASHLLMDVAPHYDPAGEIGYVLDASGGLAALALIARSRAVRRTDPRHAALAGALGSGLPDLELLIKLWDRDHPFEDYRLPWHNGTLPHRQTTPLYSTLSQAALWLLMLWLARRKLRRASGTAGRGG
ncbi:MAG: hypothetical protein KKF41_08005 [Actinobacteria bacterium]|nr:hypothetical protein [Actinomycetota bacterium]MBU1943625.1 hypothetical protein [Actinomycetota bacterium]MBU2687514.1 hypothetical protein [Actinomycetota bacterium]